MKIFTFHFNGFRIAIQRAHIAVCHKGQGMTAMPDHVTLHITQRPSTVYHMRYAAIIFTSCMSHELSCSKRKTEFFSLFVFSIFVAIRTRSERKSVIDFAEPEYMDRMDMSDAILTRGHKENERMGTTRPILNVMRKTILIWIRWQIVRDAKIASECETKSNKSEIESAFEFRFRWIRFNLLRGHTHTHPNCLRQSTNNNNSKWIIIILWFDSCMNGSRLIAIVVL